MHHLAPDTVVQGRILGEDAPVRVDLRRGRGRWTVLVFEHAATARRLYEIASLRGNFQAEAATLLVVSPTPAEWAEQPVPVVHDAGDAIRADFGVRGSVALVLDPEGRVWHTGTGRRCEASALSFIAGMRMGRPLGARSVALAA